MSIVEGTVLVAAEAKPFARHQLRKNSRPRTVSFFINVYFINAYQCFTPGSLTPPCLAHLYADMSALRHRPGPPAAPAP